MTDVTQKTIADWIIDGHVADAEFQCTKREDLKLHYRFANPYPDTTVREVYLVEEGKGKTEALQLPRYEDSTRVERATLVANYLASFGYSYVDFKFTEVL